MWFVVWNCLYVVGRLKSGFRSDVVNTNYNFSAFKMQWWLHGLFLGFVASIPMAIPVMGQMEIFIGTFVMGMIYGFLTELITTKLLKAKAALVQ